MTDNVTAAAAHVAAVADALRDDVRNNGVNCPDPSCLTCTRERARIAVETLTPLIRAQVAAEIRAERDRIRKQYEANLFTYGSAVEPGSRDYDSEIAMDTLDTAARIAEGTP
jgi:hypothetical protein